MNLISHVYLASAIYFLFCHYIGIAQPSDNSNLANMPNQFIKLSDTEKETLAEPFTLVELEKVVKKAKTKVLALMAIHASSVKVLQVSIMMVLFG